MAVIAHAAASVFPGVAVEDLSPNPAQRHAHSIAEPRNRREVQGDRDDVAWPGAPSQVEQHTVVGVAAVDPLETVLGAIAGVKRAFPAVDAVELGHAAE